MLRNSVHCTHTPKVHFARHLRREQTLGEVALWRQLRAKRFHGIKFRRQVPIGPYIVDFLCVEKRFIIEIDGETHAEPGAWARDKRREAFLRKQGFNVLRFEDWLVIEECDEVLEKIEKELGLD
ncbi:MAG: endonuclease domain-containing protein [Candidatus Peribacter sp.]|jgi:very-short-patch-repair endonuclease